MIPKQSLSDKLLLVPLHGANRQRPTNRKGVDLNKVSGIYRLDLGNGYFYLGSAVDVSRREREHRKQLQRGAHHNQVVQNCWNKYQVFVFTVVEQCEIQELLIKEQLIIDAHFSDPKNTNLAPTAGSCLGRIHSADTRAKMSAWQIGKIHSAQTRERISFATKGKKGYIPSLETRAKRSASLKGYVHSAETRLKMSEAQRRRRHAS